jgi:hypothetical protein
MSQTPDENFFKNAAENVNIPKKMKIDLDTPLEIFFLVCFCAASLGVLVTAATTATSYITGKGNIYEATAMGVLVVLAALMLKCRRETDNYYVLDTPGRKLLYHYKFFYDIKTTIIAEFDDIKCVAVGGTRSVNKGNVTWTYHIYAVDKKGERTYLSNMFSESAIAENNQKCQGIASVIGCAQIDGEPQKVLAVKGAGEGGEISVSLAAHDAAGSPQIKSIQANVKIIIAVVLAIDLIIGAIVLAVFLLRMK